MREASPGKLSAMTLGLPVPNAGEDRTSKSGRDDIPGCGETDAEARPDGSCPSSKVGCGVATLLELPGWMSLNS